MAQRKKAASKMTGAAVAAEQQAEVPRAKPTPATLTADDDRVLECVSASFATTAGQPLFTTAVLGEALWGLFLDSLPAGMRQTYNCNICRRFVEQFGGLVTIDPEDGSSFPAMWHHSSVPAAFERAFSKLLFAVEGAKVTGVFMVDSRRKDQPKAFPTHLGVPMTGPWHHFAVDAMKGGFGHVFTSIAGKTANQRAAELAQDFQGLQRALAEYPLTVITEAVRMLDSGELYRSEVALTTAKWLMALQQSLERPKRQTVIQKANKVWHAVASAPLGFAHVRSGVLGTLLQDIQDGLPAKAVAERWQEKLNPTQYRRMTAAPKAGQVARAEELVEKMGLACALKRRFAKLADIAEWLWKPRSRAVEPEGAGVFDHLLPGQHRAGRAPDSGIATTMTFEKFRTKVLPEALMIEFRARRGDDSFIALTTAQDPLAPPLMQWDREPRNPVSWFMYLRGSPARYWSLLPEVWVPVACVTRLPARWFDSQYSADGAIFVLSGAVPIDTGEGSSCIFPEHLRGELHEVRSTIEAHSKKDRLAGYGQEAAIGIDVRAGDGALRGEPHRLRVTTALGVSFYDIDRFD